MCRWSWDTSIRSPHIDRHMTFWLPSALSDRVVGSGSPRAWMHPVVYPSRSVLCRRPCEVSRKRAAVISGQYWHLALDESKQSISMAAACPQLSRATSILSHPATCVCGLDKPRKGDGPISSTNGAGAALEGIGERHGRRLARNCEEISSERLGGLGCAPFILLHIVSGSVVCRVAWAAWAVERESRD
jgi:hypothetical protein